TLISILSALIIHAIFLHGWPGVPFAAEVGFSFAPLGGLQIVAGAGLLRRMTWGSRLSLVCATLIAVWALLMEVWVHSASSFISGRALMESDRFGMHIVFLLIAFVYFALSAAQVLVGKGQAARR